MKKKVLSYLLVLLTTLSMGLIANSQVHADSIDGSKYVTGVTWKKKNDDLLNVGKTASNKLTAKLNKNMLLDYALDFSGEKFAADDVITLPIPDGFTPQDLPAGTMINGTDEKGKAFPFATISVQNGQLQLLVTKEAAGHEMKTGDVRFLTDFTATPSETGGSQSVTFPGNTVFNYSYVKSTSDNTSSDTRWITKTGTQDTAAGGAPFLGSITWTIRINNNKGLEIDDAAITDMIPAGLTLDPSSIKANLYSLSASASVTSKTPLATVPVNNVIVSSEGDAQKLTVRLGDLSEFTANKTTPVAAMITYTTTVNNYFPNKVKTYTNTAKLFGNDNPLDMNVPDSQTQPFVSAQGSTTLTSNHDGEVGGSVTAGTVMVAQPPYNVAVTKYGTNASDASIRNLLGGAEFTLIDMENDKVLAVQKTDANGKLDFQKLLDPAVSRTYQLAETTAPDGYEISKGVYNISITPAAAGQWAVNVSDVNDATQLLSSTALSDLTTDAAITSLHTDTGTIDFSVLDKAIPAPVVTPTEPENVDPVDDDNTPNTEDPTPDVDEPTTDEGTQPDVDEPTPDTTDTDTQTDTEDPTPDTTDEDTQTDTENPTPGTTDEGTQPDVDEPTPDTTDTDTQTDTENPTPDTTDTDTQTDTENPTPDTTDADTQTETPSSDSSTPAPAGDTGKTTNSVTSQDSHVTTATGKTLAPAKPVIKTAPMPTIKPLVKTPRAPQPAVVKHVTAAPTSKKATKHQVTTTSTDKTVKTGSKKLPQTGLQANMALVALGAFLAALGGLTLFVSRRKN